MYIYIFISIEIVIWYGMENAKAKQNSFRDGYSFRFQSQTVAIPGFTRAEISSCLCRPGKIHWVSRGRGETEKIKNKIIFHHIKGAIGYTPKTSETAVHSNNTFFWLHSPLWLLHLLLKNKQTKKHTFAELHSLGIRVPGLEFRPPDWSRFSSIVSALIQG